ncbi:hypothetical protein CH333_01900 [candidate division WOR-3 bacterium JGI_Cruoil_03_44_89]|uniref:Glycosyltransferase family 1 protein n=1 Tax=candidate division WOR-3 bacterium JGI_Cruoil_03_44_89 TaxID=1973748 RepID=A0A235BZZ5_UNCW3|nr:MAG: hypothetical protein CH333_01900 [candidate division WOR-3 bacterium JGI_Cruoil_03_44_89]
MKILYLESYGDIVGGGQVSLLYLLKNLNRDGFIPLVVVPNEGSLTDELERHKIRFEILPMPPLRGWKNLLVPITVKRLLYLARKEKIDLIHSNTTNSALYGVLVSRILKIPHIWWVRVEPRLNLPEKIVAHLTTYIAVVSEFVGARLPQERLSVVYNGVDTERFKPNRDNRFRRELGMPDGVFLVGTVGQLLPYKGHKFLIRAAKRATEEEKNIRFVIVGGERKKGYRKELENETHHFELGDAISFVGFRKDIPSVLNSLDLFVCPSTAEHFGRVIIEAMSCGLPVVAINSGGVPEIVVDNVTGILVPPGDISALADAILYIKRNLEEPKRMGENGRKRVERYFSIEKNVCLTEKMYRKLGR